MIKNYYWTLLLLTLFSNSFAQQVSWKKSTNSDVYKLEKMDREAIPDQFSIYKSNIEELKSILNIKAKATINALPKISFPTPEGSTIEFEIREIPVLSEKLSEKYPSIKSYLGIGTKNSNESIRFSITPFGLHAVMYSPKSGINYLDTYTADQKYFISYNREQIDNPTPFNCLVESSDTEDDTQNYYNDSPKVNHLTNTAQYREYRLAMACTIEYSKFHINAANALGIPTTTDLEKKTVVLAAMATTMTRVNFIYERDLGIHMNLVDNNDDIIFLHTDNFDNSNAYNLINQSQTVINDSIGSANYDIGHTVSTGGGGLANIYAPCNNRIKAMGITGSYSPVGDPFDVDFVAHEIGHQFGANHTFNSSCSRNRNNRTAVEPGSGNSIMAYAGVCASDPGQGNVNVQRNSTPFFNSISIDEITNFVNQRGNCSENTPIQSPAPVANAAGDRILPVGTPFYLEAIVDTTAGITNYTYNWEQINTDISIQPPLSTSEFGPNFKFIAPTAEPVRYFPNFNDIVSKNNTPWEVLPTVPRTMNFRLLVRDNNPLEGGQTAYEDIQVDFVQAGPFVITHPNAAGLEFEAGTTQTIQWDVAGTDANQINTTHVNILFSADNGLTFTTLIAQTPNDGSQDIDMPNYTTQEALILIQPTNSSYYALSMPFEITQGTASIESQETSSFSIYPNPTSDILNIIMPKVNSGILNIDIYDLTGRRVHKESPKASTNSTNEHQISLQHLSPGTYLVKLSDGSSTKSIKIIKQ